MQESKCDKAKEAAKINESRTPFKIVRYLSDVHRTSRNAAIKTKLGQLLVTD